MLIMSEQLGERIKQLRLDKNLTLKDVAKRTGLSISFISQLEHNKTSATLESFKKISDALGVNPSYFFNTPNTDVTSAVVRGALNQIDYEKNTFIYRDLKGNMDHPLFMPILVVLHPGDNRGNNFTHEGQEFLYVLEGTLTVLLNEQKFTLEPNDCIFLDTSKPHYLQKHKVEAVTIIYCADTA